MQSNIKKLLIVAIGLFAIAIIVTMIGALCKLQHWPIAGSLLIGGMCLQALSFVIGGFTLIQHIRTK